MPLSAHKLLVSAPLYDRFYTEAQRAQMTREHIVPDCMFFYMLSIYPLKDYEVRSQYERDLHVGKIMWIVNSLLDKKFFSTKYVEKVDRYVRKNSLSAKQRTFRNSRPPRLSPR